MDFQKELFCKMQTSYWEFGNGRLINLKWPTKFRWKKNLASSNGYNLKRYSTRFWKGGENHDIS